MARRGWNPCLVCEGLVCGPKGGVVCDECRRKVREYETIRERYLADRVSLSLRQYPYVPGRNQTKEGPNARKVLDDLLCELRVVTRPAGESWRPAPGETASSSGLQPRIKSEMAQDWHRVVINVPKELAQFLLDLEPAIYNAVHEAEDDGKRLGTNLLARLAAGDLTTDEFQKKAGIMPVDR